MNHKNHLTKSSYTKRSRAVPMAENSNRLSHSAMSSRSFSRVKSNQIPFEALQKSLTFLSEDENVNGSEAVEEEDEYEAQLHQQLLEQQHQLKELQDRQHKLLSLQKQMEQLDQTAENSMASKLDKLQSARSRIDQLQGLVDTIKSSEKNSQVAAISYPNHESISQALSQLKELKGLVDSLSKGVDGGDCPSTPSSVSSLKPIFYDHVALSGTSTNLPEVTVVKHSRSESPINKPEKNKRRQKNMQVIVAANSFNKGKSNTTAMKNLSSDSEELWKEMQRHQILLKELKERREELENVMKETDELKANNLNLTATPASVKFENEAEFSVNDPCDFETSDSGRLFGLNEQATKKLIDIIRAQKNLDTAGMTEKTTATWGSSDTDSSDCEEDSEEENYSNDESDKKYGFKENVEELNYSMQSSQHSQGNDTLALAHESRPVVQPQSNREKYSNEHEIDMRPPTRRQTEGASFEKFASMDEWKDSLAVVQQDLESSEVTMQLLLEDQQSLQRLLQNSLNIQNNSFSNKVCYGISPDFLLYQLDNCYNQVLSLQKTMNTLQWKLYDVMGNPPTATNRVIKRKSRPQTATTSSRNSYSPKNIPANRPVTAPNTSNSSYYDKYARKTHPAIQITKVEKHDQKPLKRSQRNKIPSGDRCENEFLQKSNQASTKYKKSLKDNQSDNELFESLRDNIYSEAAILISQNETRPHFLMELFHCLQQMNTDLLRQQCLYNVQDVLKGYISRNSQSPNNNKQPLGEKPVPQNTHSLSYSENTPSESAVTSDDEIYAKLRAKVAKENSYDYSVDVSSGSELSTPSDDEAPFASEDLGSTVIHLDAALRHMREVERIKLEQETSSTTPTVESVAMMSGDAQTASRAESVSMVDSKELNSTIKKVISDVIPILKEDRENVVDIEFLATLQSTVINSVLNEVRRSNESKQKSRNMSLESFFTKQLQTILSKSMLKFVAQRVGSCGEELVLNMSEVLFNELAFYFMMQDMDKGEHSSDSANKKQVNGIESFDENHQDDHADKSSITEIEDVPCNSEQSSEKEHASNQGNDGTSNEQISTEEGTGLAVTIDLSAAETKPLTSYGSGEDEEEGSGDEYTYNDADVPTSIQHDEAEGKKKQESEEEKKDEDIKEDADSTDAKIESKLEENNSKI